MMTSSNGGISSQNGWTHPPKRKSPAASSSGPPGACITPSSERKTAPVSLRIDRLSGGGCLDLCNVDLAHRHHRLERARGRGLVRIVVGLEQRTRRDLPREAPFVLAPAAGAFLAAILRDRVPVAVGLLLVLGHDHEADGLVRFEVGPAVQADELAPENGEIDGQFVTLVAVRIIAWRSHRRADAAIREDGRVEFGGLARFAFVEPKAGRQLVGHYFLRVAIFARRTSALPGPWTAANSRPAM